MVSSLSVMWYFFLKKALKLTLKNLVVNELLHAFFFNLRAISFHLIYKNQKSSIDLRPPFEKLRFINIFSVFPTFSKVRRDNYTPKVVRFFLCLFIAVNQNFQTGSEVIT